MSPADAPPPSPPRDAARLPRGARWLGLQLRALALLAWALGRLFAGLNAALFWLWPPRPRVFACGMCGARVPHAPRRVGGGVCYSPGAHAAPCGAPCAHGARPWGTPPRPPGTEDPVAAAWHGGLPEHCPACPGGVAAIPAWKRPVDP